MDCHSSDVFQPVAGDPGAAEILPLNIAGDLGDPHRRSFQGILHEAEILNEAKKPEAAK
ncbi:MAG: hypothetical protein L0Y36_08945 [Planctomycetales bacterium]|nr:hypothetical protein [Planctomycetales bacterium]